MFEIVAQMGLIILFGAAWRLFRPGGLEPQLLRKALTDTVYYLLLPALVLSVLWRAELGNDTVHIVVLALLGIGSGLLLGYLSCRWCKRLSAPATGALILAATFPNATYLGLPVLEVSLGPWARSVAIQYDLFACTPLLFTVGILVARHYGQVHEHGRKEMLGDARNPLLALFGIPAVIAAIAAVALNVTEVAMPTLVQGLLTTLERGVVPLMLFSLGLSLRWSRDQWCLLPYVMPVAAIQLLLTPAIVLAAGSALGMDGPMQVAVVIESAMPSMVLGVVLCERFRLDSALYAAAVTVSTALSLVTLPFWFTLLGHA
ncbi:MAG: AEC family transporter [Gammaproteobacteria bacterium]|nr:AEC family transporter [Gammaproteobacteria bacterium]